jgi:uncharacterized protein (TIGR02466 family)
MPVRPLFVTRIYEHSLASDAGFDDFNAELEDAVRMLAAEDRGGRAWCKDNGYRGYTSYSSLNDLPKRVTVFAELKRVLDRHAAVFADLLFLDLGGRKLKLDNLWVNVLKPGGTHSGHIHPHCTLSGTIYVACSPGADSLKIEDPRLPLMMAAPPRRDDAPESERTFVYLPTAPGTLYLWESWLRHEVPPNVSKLERISVSFNYAWR